MQEQQNETVRIQDILSVCLSKWKWFVLSVVLCLGAATLYILTTPPTYTRNTALLIKEDSNGKSASFSSELNSFADMGLFSNKSNVNNELVFMQSPALMLEVVKRLQLDYNYSIDGTFYKKTIYGRSLPVNALVEDIADNDACSFKLSLATDGKVSLSEFRFEGDKVSEETTAEGSLRDTLSTPIGKVIITPTPYFVPGEASMIYVSRQGLVATVEYCQEHLTANLNSDKTTIINLSYKDVSVQRAEEFLNTLISVYNENWVKDKNQIAVSTSRFIDERLRVIEHELGNVDENISSYKSEHLIPDIREASTMYMQQANEANAQILTLNNELYMARYIRSFVSNESNVGQLLPANSGINSANIESLIAEYNTKQLKRNSLVANSSTNNPLVKDLDNSLASMREAIITSIDNQINSLNTQISSFRSREQESNSLIASNPTQAKYLLSVERQQKVKESLYLFLLQKREENELSQAFTAYNTRVVTPPTGKLKPTSPVKRNILLLALLIGLLIPIGAIVIIESTYNKVRGRKDIENTGVPLAGEIPLYDQSRRYLIFKKPKINAEKAIVVKEGCRDVVNEAFRVLRSNVDFMTGSSKGENVIVCTSFNPGSGKSFLSLNLAISFAIKKRRTLVIDGDLRHGTSSAFVGSPSKGLSSYLSGKIDDWRSLIVKDPSHEYLNILPVGIIPPNPTELLEEPRLASLLEELRSEYDYIFIDCPPIDLVADTQIIEKLADRTLFVVRCGLLDRSMLPELEEIYTQKRFKNLSVVLNGAQSTGGRYGYRYGYHSGYYYGKDSYYGDKKSEIGGGQVAGN